MQIKLNVDFQEALGAIIKKWRHQGRGRGTQN